MPLFSKKGGKHRNVIKDCSYENIDEDGLPQLHRLIIKCEKHSKLKSFISGKTVNINEKDSQGRTALHLAAATSSEKALLVLLQSGLHVDIDGRDKDGKTALFKAVEVFSHQCVLILTEHGASTDLWDNHKSTPLHIATVNRKPLIIAVICNAHGNINIKDKMGYSPLHVASAFGYLEIGKQLIESGADVNAKDNHGRTPLMAASCEGTIKMVRLLLERGSDPALQDVYGHSAVYYSVQSQSESMTMILKEAIEQREYLNKNEMERIKAANESKEGNDLPLDAWRKSTSFHERKPDSNLIEAEKSLASTKNGHVEESLQEKETIISIEAVPFTMHGELVVKKESVVGNKDQESENKRQNNGENERETAYDNEENSNDSAPAEKSSLKITEVMSDAAETNVKSGEIDVVLSSKETSTSKKNVASGTDSGEFLQLKQRNRELREVNVRLKRKISEILKEVAINREEHKQNLGYQKSRLQFLNLKNENLLEEKIKQCSRLENKLYEAYDTLLTEIQNVKEGNGLDQLSKDIIKGMKKKLKASESKINRLTKQLKVAREEKSLLDTESEALRGEVIILNEIISKTRKEQKYFDEFSKDLDSNDAARLRDLEIKDRVSDNEALLDSLNKLRKENAMLKEQHISDKHEFQLINCELNDTKDQVITLKYQIETMKFDAADYSSLLMSKQADSIKRHKISIGSGKFIERAKSDSTVHGFRTFDSTFDFFDKS